MVNIILHTAVFELGYMWNWGSVYNTIPSATSNNQPNLATPFASLERVLDRAIQTTMDAAAKTRS